MGWLVSRVRVFSRVGGRALHAHWPFCSYLPYKYELAAGLLFERHHFASGRFCVGWRGDKMVPWAKSAPSLTARPVQPTPAQINIPKSITLRTKPWDETPNPKHLFTALITNKTSQTQPPDLNWTENSILSKNAIKESVSVSQNQDLHKNDHIKFSKYNHFLWKF